VQIVTPADPWKRKLFNGLAEIVVRSSRQAGPITVKAEIKGLLPASTELESLKAEDPPFVP
jgi:beta-galactosidase